MVVKKIILILLEKLRKICLFPVGVVRYFLDLFSFIHSQASVIMPIKGFIPMLFDRYAENGSIDRHYFLQDIYMARKIIQEHSEKHFDIGSRVDGFIGHLLSGFQGDVVVIDIRPLKIQVDNLHFVQADATNLENLDNDSIMSLSSLHAIEHFGLGRYSDKIDPNACFTAMKSLQRVLQKNGRLYFSVPIGKTNGVYFNSHRMFYPLTILRTFDELTLMEFSYIHNYKIYTYVGETARRLIELDKLPISDYDCGMFIFSK